MKYDYLEKWKKRAYERTEGRGKSLSFLLEKPENKNDIIFDLHNHSNFSDGKRSADALYKRDSENNVSVFSFADHDTTRAYNEFDPAKTNFTGKTITGVEITTHMKGDIVEIHVYDYDIKKANQLIQSGEFPFLRRESRKIRFTSLLAQRIELINKLCITDKPIKLSDILGVELENSKGNLEYLSLSMLGIDIDAQMKSALANNEVIQQVGIKGKMINLNFDDFNTKLYNLVASTEKGKNFFKDLKINGVSTPIEGFRDFNRILVQRADSPLYVNDKKYFPTPEEVCEFAKKCGGVAIFAHPYGYPNLKTPPEELMRRAYKAGVDGFECLHGFNEPDEVEKIYKFCYEHDLLISAGSDVHGYRSIQGNQTEPGLVPSKGSFSKDPANQLEDAKLSTYNLHYFGSGAYRGEKEFSIDNEPQLEM